MGDRQYRIGELAKVLGISRQMLRYYEDCGVINPDRGPDNNYRLYSVRDYFALSDAMILSRFGIRIKDIFALKTSEYAAEVVRHFREFVEKQRAVITQSEMMVRRAFQLIDKTEAVSLNVGNRWVKKVPAHTLFPLMSSKDDEYGELCIPSCVTGYINSTECIAFEDAIVEFNEDGEFWWISIDDEYTKHLSIPECVESRAVPAQYCLCTVVDMGEFGQFDGSRARALAGSLGQTGFVRSGNTYGMLLMGGKEGGGHHRYLEVRIPIKKA